MLADHGRRLSSTTQAMNASGKCFRSAQATGSVRMVSPIALIREIKTRGAASFDITAILCTGGMAECDSLASEGSKKPDRLLCNLLGFFARWLKTSSRLRPSSCHRHCFILYKGPNHRALRHCLPGPNAIVLLPTFLPPSRSLSHAMSPIRFALLAILTRTSARGVTRRRGHVSVQ